ncbi:MAG: hypothetical protein M0006_15890 [Magnetospirillum sp.]|nr:hypothetical protein [Magnetospirillum sp.]
MAGFLRIFLLIVLLISTYSVAIHRASLSIFVQPRPENSLAYIQRLYHTAAINYKLANPNATGPLDVTLPYFLTGANLAVCANTNTVATYTTLASTSEAAAIAQALQSNPGGAGIGLSTGAGTIQTGQGGPIPAACAIPRGAAVIQTQVLP